MRFYSLKINLKGEAGLNQEELKHFWDQVLQDAQKIISKPSFDTWLKSTELIAYENEQLTVSVPNSFTRDWLAQNYVNTIQDVVKKLTGSILHINFIQLADDDFKMPSTKPKKVPTSDSNEHSPGMLNMKNTFDTFVIGPGNRFAHAASLAVAEAPAKAYNPLFLHGGVGLGKTHLMHAIGHYVLDHDPNAKVVYLSSEKFTNEFINSIRDNNTEAFRNKYRKVDVLLIDDIQFLAGKESTQEEFFHTFNTLHEESKQIIISSDRQPKEIPTLEDRLRSRFEWGLIIDIGPPDLETRIAILRKKADADGLEISNDVMAYIASQIDSNIRELEGALIRVVAYSNLLHEQLTPELAAEALKNIIPSSTPKAVSILDIQKVVGEHFSLKLEDFAAKKRTKSIAFPRQVAMYLSRELTDFSLPKIGEEFGGRDHTTVIHAHEKISTLLKTDANLQDDMKQIKSKLGN